MPITRRTLLISAAALPAAQFALSASPAAAASSAGDVVGKITVGYQGWFACIGDGAPINAWWHWSQNEAAAPSPSNENLKAWPDMTIYSAGYKTAYANLNNGGAPNLFSSYDQQVLNTHCSLMQANGIDTIALQRFDPNGREGPTRNAITAKLNTAAQSSGRKFYIMYDASGWTNMKTEMPADWTNVMSQYASSSAYAHQNGKPVVGIWGFGFNDANHPWSAADCLSVIQWFQSQGCYVMGGVPTYWRTGVNDSRAGYLNTYSAFNMISPWMVGRIGTVTDSNNFYTNVNVGDQAYCNSNNIDYQPCVLPGDLSANQRAHGDFMWEQFYNMVRVGAQGIYISMFDEFGEGNQIVNTAPTQAYVPSNSGLNSLDQDGTACSADYYLRLTGDGGKMLKGQIALTNVRPTQPVVSGGGGPQPGTNLALNKPTSASGSTSGFPPSNAVDGNTSSYWESTDNAFPQWLQVDLGTTYALGSLTLTLPPSSSWSTRTQTIQVLGSTDNSTFTQIVAATGYSFNPSTGNSVSITLPTTTTRYVRLNFTANSAWPAGQISEFQVYAASSGSTTQPPTAPGNLQSTSVTYNSVALSWTASTSSVGLAGYTVEEINGSTTSSVGTTSSTTFTVSGLSASTTYQFAVTAKDTQGNVSAASNTVTVTTSAAPTNTNYALNQPATASGYTQSYTPSNTVDGNTSTYWESTDNAFPQWIQVDLGSSVSVGRVVMDLPPSTSWSTRTQTVTIQGSTDGTNYTTLAASTGYTFNPSTGNSATATFAAATARYVKLTFTANTGWPAGQLSELQVYGS